MNKVQEFCSKDGCARDWHDAVLYKTGRFCPGWALCEYDDKRLAEIYAYLWCNDVSGVQASFNAPTMQINVPMGFRSSATMGEEVLMRIIEER